MRQGKWHTVERLPRRGGRLPMPHASAASPTRLDGRWRFVYRDAAPGSIDFLARLRCQIEVEGEAVQTPGPFDITEGTVVVFSIAYDIVVFGNGTEPEVEVGR
jgi:hypothetical protein